MRVGHSPYEIHFLGGITASGKSAFSLEWAKNRNAEILSCDSIAVYKGMNVGSAKPTDEDRKKIPHHGLDLCRIDEEFNVIRFFEYAKQVVRKTMKERKNLLVVGGSGFYLQSFFEPIADGVIVTDHVRRKVREIEASGGRKELLAQLTVLNPQGLGNLDVHNPRRLIRCLERCMSSGRSLEELSKDFKSLPNPFVGIKKNVLWLDRENPDVERRIHHRTQRMLEDGLVEETKGLLEEGLEQNPVALRAVGYREAVRFIRGEYCQEQMVRKVNTSTRQLVSKQRKWFRKRLPLSSRFVLQEGYSVNHDEVDWISGA